MENCADKVDIKPVSTASTNSAELKSVTKKPTEIAAVCKDGVCTLNWKPRRPETENAA